MSDTEKLKARYDAFSDAWKLYKKYFGTKNRINGKEDDIPLVFDEPSKRIAESEGDLRFTLGWERKPAEYEQIDFTDMEDIEF